MRFRKQLVAMTLLTGWACGGSAPTSPVLPAGEPAPAPSPTPAPTPSPSAAPAPQAPTDANGRYPNGETPVVRFTIKIQWIIDREDRLREYKPGDAILVGEQIRFDSQGKDKDNNPTEGWDREPRWSWEPDELANLSTDRGFNPRAKVKAAGSFSVSASLDGVDSETLVLTFVE